MKFIADLHVHSKYSRATSKEMSPESLWKWAQLKGIKVVGTGDFTHPAWFSELETKFESTGNGLFGLREEFQTGDVPASCRSDVSFLLTAEISCIYSKNGRTRKIHCIVFVPEFAGAAGINKALSKIGNLASDGRPILGLDAKELLRIIINESSEAMLIPAHAWTPHFSVFGAMSGFDSLEECFEDLTPHVYAIETGLSSDPSMNRRLSALDNITLISNSDAHSPSKLGREANIFDTNVSYMSMTGALKTGNGFPGTIEFFPEEGKYHYDGHRACDVCLSPEETIRCNYLCPVCGRKLTIGVMHRVEKLADRKEDFRGKGPRNYYSIIPLDEIISETIGVGPKSKAVGKIYSGLLDDLGNEFKILLDTPVEDIEKAGSSRLAEAVSRVRDHKVHIAPGYDGEYGKIKIFGKTDRKEIKGQERLF